VTTEPSPSFVTFGGPGPWLGFLMQIGTIRKQTETSYNGQVFSRHRSEFFLKGGRIPLEMVRRVKE